MEERDFFQEETIDIKEIIFKLLLHWKLFVAFIIIGAIGAYFYNKTQKIVYATTTTILINNEKTSLDPQSVIGLEIFDEQSEIQNEIEILKSQTLMQTAFNNLEFNNSYYIEEHFSSNELYKNSPFEVKIDSNYLQPLGYKINIVFISKDSVQIDFNDALVNLLDPKTRNTYPDYEITTSTIRTSLNELIVGEFYGFTIRLTAWFNPKNHINQEFSFMLRDFKSNAAEFNDITFENIDKSTVIKINLNHHHLLKSIDFLNELTGVYLKKELENKNNIANKTLLFIDKHLSEINDSLYLSEKSLQEYQASKSALNIDFQTERMFEMLENLQNQKAEILINKKYYDYLIQTLNEDKLITDIIAPSIMNVNNPILTTQISNLIQYQAEINNLKISEGRENPYVRTLASKIENAKNVIIEYIQNENSNIDITLQDIDNRINESIERINSLPKTQRELFNFERSFKVYDNIYTFLLQKRSETLLAKASNVPLNEIIDKASVNNYEIIGNKKKLNYMIAFVFSIIIPGLFVYIKYYLNGKVLSDKDIENETTAPILGHILKSKQSNNVFENAKSPIAESFRMLRTNLDFARKTDGTQTILVTSTMQGEGKSFISNNLSRSLALNQKKTILLVFDLRKPKLYFDLPTNNIGLSNYFIGKSTIDEIIQKTKVENLDVINSGTLPPNPSELIASDKTHVLIETLKEEYDYIIIDTPPIGIISDGLQLTKYADINIFVARFNYTRTKALSNLMRRIKTHNISNLNIVVNSVETNNTGYGYYGEYGSYSY